MPYDIRNRPGAGGGVPPGSQEGAAPRPAGGQAAPGPGGQVPPGIIPGSGQDGMFKPAPGAFGNLGQTSGVDAIGGKIAEIERRIMEAQAGGAPPSVLSRLQFELGQLQQQYQKTALGVINQRNQGAPFGGPMSVSSSSGGGGGGGSRMGGGAGTGAGRYARNYDLQTQYLMQLFGMGGGGRQIG